jgi:cytidyltransferase-like protein
MEVSNKMIYSFPDNLPHFPKGKKVVLVGGVFDLIHIGHLDFLKAAKGQGDVLVVALESKDIVLQSKNRNPVHSQLQRAEILSYLNCVDGVILLPPMKGYEDYLKLVTELKPHVIAVTKGEPYIQEKEQQAALVGARVMIVNNRIRGFSTTDILDHYCK